MEALRAINAAVRRFCTRASRPRKSHECKQCAKLRKELAPIISALTSVMLMSDVAVELAREQEVLAAVREWPQI